MSVLIVTWWLCLALLITTIVYAIIAATQKADTDEEKNKRMNNVFTAISCFFIGLLLAICVISMKDEKESSNQDQMYLPSQFRSKNNLKYRFMY